MFVAIALLRFCPGLAVALPFQGNETNATTSSPGTSAETRQTVGWKSAPQVRGTFDLLLSCMTTLSLCAWTAYHPNVYAHRAGWKIFSHRITWMLVAVLFPEIVLWCAWEQWWAAKSLERKINALGERAFDGVGLGGHDATECSLCMRADGGGEKESGEYCLDLLFEESTSACKENTETGRRHLTTTPRSRSWKTALRSLFRYHRQTSKPPEPPNWTRVQSFFAISGGFAVSSSTFYPSPLLTLTPPALVFLARHGLLPRSTPTAVADKSKADAVAKLLVCLQAGWFLIQSIARVAQKLPLSLIELHVLAHVGCAFAMYAVWKDKPYDVGTPLLCENEKVQNIVAFWALHVDSVRVCSNFYFSVFFRSRTFENGTC
jgi:hypothetical protein